MLQSIINWLWLRLPVSRKTYFINSRLLNDAAIANTESIENLRITINGLRNKIIELEAKNTFYENNNEQAQCKLAHLGNIQTRISVNKNIVFLSYDLQVSPDTNMRAVTPFCPALDDKTLALAVSADSLFLNVIRPWVMGASDDILLTHIRFGPYNPELPEHYQKFVAANNEANKLLASALKEDNK